MPRIQVTDPSGRPYTIESSDPELLSRWLIETLPKTSGPPPYNEVRMRVDPSWIRDPVTGRDIPDWPPNSSRTFDQSVDGHGGGVEGVRALVLALERWAEEQR